MDCWYVVEDHFNLPQFYFNVLFSLIVGKPAILLHTRDGGKQFERIPLSPKLPGEPVSIVSTGISKAEMITSQGK